MGALMKCMVLIVVLLAAGALMLLGGCRSGPSDSELHDTCLDLLEEYFGMFGVPPDFLEKTGSGIPVSREREGEDTIIVFNDRRMPLVAVSMPVTYTCRYTPSTGKVYLESVE